MEKESSPTGACTASEISSVIITRRIQPSTQYETLGGAESHDEVWDVYELADASETGKI
ncbi:hypothetical protein C5167_017124 [Papaver somniferum]|uniref:Uncharacterized protein n=1 Tax=Papaver somniferum TaxID=3469 RepID=A0A4Y7IMK2_PAPSO|nr:hypothetical protein C5167_017124 [Papaver somniferum]